MLPCCVGQLAADRKCRTKTCLEFENNAASHTTFMRRLTCLLELPFTCCIHVFVLCN